LTPPPRVQGKVTPLTTCMRTCESWAGAVMVREGKDNIKGQAWFGWYTEQLALRISTGGLQPYTRSLSLVCHAWGLHTHPGRRDTVRQGQREVATLLWA
jgi:hypothetical protein